MNICIIKKFYIFCVSIKWLISTKKHENNNIEAIVDGIGMLCLNEKHIEEKLGHKNLLVITNKYNQVYKKHRHELVNEPKKQPNWSFT